jgi:branched-chain amino acid transport system permease protein
VIEALIQGVLLGGYYAVLAAGLSLMFGVMRFINLAHGDLAIAGAFATLFAVQHLGVSPWLAVALMLPAMAALGWVLHRLLFARTLRSGILLTLLTTFGLGAVLQNALFGVFGSDTRSLADALGALSWASWELPGGLLVGQLPVLTFVCAVVILGGLHLLLTRSRLGRAIRAASTDAEAAGLCGVDAQAVHRAASAMAVMLAGLAGTLLAMRASVDPYAGPPQLIYAFEAVVIGGIGSLWGTLLGGVVLGVAQSLGALVSPQGFQLAGHGVFLAVLLVRLLRSHGHRLGGQPMWMRLLWRRA